MEQVCPDNTVSEHTFNYSFQSRDIDDFHLKMLSSYFFIIRIIIVFFLPHTFLKVMFATKMKKSLRFFFCFESEKLNNHHLDANTFLIVEPKPKQLDSEAQKEN